MVHGPHVGFVSAEKMILDVVVVVHIAVLHMPASTLNTVPGAVSRAAGQAETSIFSVLDWASRGGSVGCTRESTGS